MTADEAVAPTCQGCHKTIEEGAVVAFGDSLFHVKCFICAKCKECVDNKTNLLLLDDGRPVCDNCSYNCASCHLVIRDEAIMTGEKAYHSECFKCTNCKKQIDDLIFTQTSKGIYCTACHDMLKQRRKNKSPESSIPQSTVSQLKVNTSTTTLPTPVRSRNNSTSASSPLKSNNESMFSNLSLSFFDEEESSELANLSDSLGINLSLNMDQSQTKGDCPTTQSRLNRASEILQSSLRTSSLLNANEWKGNDVTNTSNVNKLKQELSDSRSRLKDLEANYKVLQDASQQALNEFTQVKEDFAKESNFKKQLEFTIVSLNKKNGGILSRKEIDKVAMLRVELERTCREMIDYRDKLATTIDQNTANSTLAHSYSKNLKTQIKSLIHERDLLQAQTKDLRTSRDEVIREMVLLNTKNAELTKLNNDLSRQAIEREESVIITGPSSSPPLSPSQSTDTSSILTTTRTRKHSDASSIMCKVSSRNSFKSDQTPTLFRIKKKGSTMFSKLSGSSNSSTTSSSSSKPGKPEPSLSSSSSIYGVSPSKSIYSNTTYNSSLQSLSSAFEQNMSGSLGRSVGKNKAFMDSTASLHISPLQHNHGGDHSFHPMSFLRPVKCGACGDKIWSRSEYRCDGCGFSAHSRCLSKVPQQCLAAINTASSLDFSADHIQPSTSSSSFLSTSFENKSSLPLKKPNGDPASMFGFDLSERVQIENRSVPLIVEECIKEVEKRGLDYEGIYRKSGGAAQIRSIQLSFDHGEKINLSDEEEYNDICAITSVLKQYFRELPNPLLAYELYDTFINISTMSHDEKKIAAFTEALHKMPKAHLDTIILLFKHLQKIVEQCETNRMTVKNLSMVFAPTLMRHSDPSRDFLDISYKNATIEYILLHTTQLFP